MSYAEEGTMFGITIRFIGGKGKKLLLYNDNY